MAPTTRSNLDKSEVERIRKEARDEAIRETEAKVERIRKEVRNEAIRETEAKYKRKVEETFQCVVCLQVPRDGHITQCQNGHLICEVCANKNNDNEKQTSVSAESIKEEVI